MNKTATIALFLAVSSAEPIDDAYNFTKTYYKQHNVPFGSKGYYKAEADKKKEEERSLQSFAEQ